MILAALPLIFAMTSADAVAVLLNSPNACSVRTFELAKETVEKEAASGKPLQQFVIGLTTDDKALAKKYLDSSRERIRFLAAHKNNPLAWYLLSIEANDLKLLRKAAAGNNVQALNALGTLVTTEAFEKKNGVSTNDLEAILKKSFDYFSRAAAQRDPNGFINLGTCYLRGFGCEQDMAMAFQCFKSAAEAGHPEGMDNVSACYQFGHGVAPDTELSLFWGMRGRAARGDEAAAKWLRERK